MTSVGSPEIGGLHSVAAQHDDLVLTKFDCIPGVFDEGSDVRGQEVLAISDTNHKRAIAPRANHQVRGSRRER